MKKNVMMRAASALGVAVLLSTCVISGTFAKYTTSESSSATARVAKWGFDSAAELTINDLFTYTDDGVKSGNSDKVIAPGTKNSVQFMFSYDKTSDGISAPEVDYTFVVSTTDSECPNSIKNNPNIKWTLDTQTGLTWDQLIAAIEALDGNVTGDKYEAGTLPPEFYGTADAPISNHTIGWEWLFDKDNPAGTTDNDTNDTAMGNADALDKVTIKITITATQVN